MNSIDFSLIVPYHNEEKNLPILYSKIICSFEKISRRFGFKNFEIIFVDDGSDDNSTENLVKSIENTDQKDFNIRVVIYKIIENKGQSYALSVGFSNFNGKYVATIDSDLQNDPEDLLPMLEKIVNQEVEIVNGYRKDRNEGLRVLVSNVGNFLIKLFSNYDIRDVGCSLKIYKDYVIKDIKLPYGYHRFLPILSRSDKKSIINFPVKHFNRFYGNSHYGYSRIFWLLKNIFVLPFLRGFNISRIKNFLLLSWPLFFASFIFSLFFVKSNYLLSILFFLFSLIILVTIVRVKNFLSFQDSFSNSGYFKFFEKNIALGRDIISCKGGI
jgi:glycosyltransferase involved in cell wall biosynthesis